MIQKNSLLQDFLALTETISYELDDISTQEDIYRVEQKIDERSKIISKISKITENAMSIGGDALSESEKEQQWITEKLLEQTQTLEQANIVKMDEVVKSFMQKVRSTKESIKVIDAYRGRPMSSAGVKFNETK